MENIYGTCSRCNIPLEPVWFMEKEIKHNNGIRIETGRKRQACSYLICPKCLRKECVDDTFDGEWHY